ncbi:MAG: phosphotransferase [bacterium]
MVEYRLNPIEGKGIGKINVGIESSFTSEYIGTPLYFGKLENGSDVVLKFTRIPGGALREFNGLSLANTHSVSSPKAIALIQRDETPTDGFIMERIEGKPLNEVGNAYHEYQFGHELSKLHEIQLPGYGPITNGAGQFDNSDLYLQYWLGKTIPHMGEQSIATQLLKKLFIQGREHIIGQQPRLLHRDIKDENVLVQPNGNISIIDFEWAQGGNPFDDLGVYLYHAIRTNKPQDRVQSFFKGYFGEKELTDVEKYDLLFHLMLTAGRTLSFCVRMNPTRTNEAIEDMNKATNYVEDMLKTTPGYNAG